MMFFGYCFACFGIRRASNAVRLCRYFGFGGLGFSALQLSRAFGCQRDLASVEVNSCRTRPSRGTWRHGDRCDCRRSRAANPEASGGKEA